MPSYQASAAGALGVINALSSGEPCHASALKASYCREVPDVSALADAQQGYVAYVNGAGGEGRSGWTTVGGTSAATPVWAALIALTNAQPGCRGVTVGFANPFLYGLAGFDYAGYYRDVVAANPISGAASNDALGTTGGLYPVTPGYDMATGLGVPQAASLAGALCAVRAPVYAVALRPIGPQLSALQIKLKLTLHASDSGGVPVAYAASGLPAGLSIDSATGVISGRPEHRGASLVTVTAYDNDANRAVRTFAWVIRGVGKPTSSAVQLGGVGRRRPTLKLTIRAGVFAPPLKAVSVSLPSGLRFAAGGRGLTRGLLVKVGSKRVSHRAMVSRGVLTITLRHVAGKVFVRIRWPSLRAGASLAAAALGDRIKRVEVGLRALDSRRRSTRLAVRLFLHG
jgi:hypothetical protein